MKTIVIIPAYNEEKSIIRTVNELRHYIQSQEKYNIDYIVINDGSSDKTESILLENNVNHITHSFNLGLNASIKTGIQYAVINNYDYMIQIDGDGQHICEYITNLLDKACNGYDIVIGSRFINYKKHWSMRMLGSKILSFVIYIKSNRKQKITDPTSGMRVFNSKVQKEYLKSLSSVPNSSTVMNFYKKGFTIKEIKVNMRDRIDGESFLNLKSSMLYMLEQVIAIIFGY